MLTLLVSITSLSLGVANARAGEWHYQWGSTPVITPTTTESARARCPYSLPTGVPVQQAFAAVHVNHTWVEFDNWTTDLGYSPEAMSYHLCSARHGTSTWVSTPFFALWSVAELVRQFPSVYRANSPDYKCPDDNPFSVGAFCQTRAWW